MPNRLAQETSPYLLQHKDNPVDWMPWGEEARRRASDRDVPILLSVGYSACHWCHVMERESFEHDATAAVPNEAFVCVKVDREERPDVDQIYMTATQLFTRRGGWPNSLWLTPDGRPFFCGTYYPRAQFVQMLAGLGRAWREQPDDWWSQRLGREITPRWVLQYWGTEVCRRGFHDDIWIASLENKLRTTTDHVVISDCRFPNEIAAIRSAGGLVIRVVRGADPKWFDAAKAHFCTGSELPGHMPHASEWAWAGTDFDAMIDNNGSMDDLYQQLNDLVQDHLCSKLNRSS